MIIDYAMLKLIWWFIVGILMIGYAIMDGYDLGVAGLLPFIGKNDVEKRIMINTIAPHWDGNQVWLIALGGCIFAGWPQVYAVSFSGFYFAMLLILFALILRPLCLEYRSKVNEKNKKYLDGGLMIGGILVPLLSGVAIGNLFQGFGFHFDAYMRVYFTEGLLGLLNPFGIFCGILSLCMIWLQGATWLALRVGKQEMSCRAIGWAKYLAWAVLILFTIGGFWVFYLPSYEILQIDPNGSANPLHKLVIEQSGGWLMNYKYYSWAILAPICGFLGGLLVLLTISKVAWLAFLGSSMTICGIITTAGISLFPFLLPSNIDPKSSLTIWDATSSESTLAITIGVAMIFLVIIILYTIWSHYKMWRKLTDKIIETESAGLY